MRFNSSTNKKFKKYQILNDEDYAFYKMDFYFITPIILSVILIISLIIFVPKKKININYCEHSYSSKCVPCPDNGDCKTGRLICNIGYKKENNKCIMNDNEERNIAEYSSKIEHYIASSINKYCNESLPVTKYEIIEMFGDSPYFEQALEMLKNSVYNIYFNGEYYVSLKPIVSKNCEMMKRKEDNRLTMILMCVVIILIIILIISIQNRNRIKNEIHSYAKKIINTLIEECSDGSFIYADRIRLDNENPLSKYWNEIINEIERTDYVITLIGKNGRMWRIDS